MRSIAIACLSILLMATSCKNDNTAHSNTVSGADGHAQADMRQVMKEFRNNFEPINIPAVLPEEAEKQAGKEIPHKQVEMLFAGYHFKPAFGGEKDVADLAENLESSKYYPAGMFQGEKYTAYIIRKKDEDNYYYLCTTDEQGNFISGLCVAFLIGTEADNTTRTASINEDHSLIIAQQEVTQGQKNETGNREFFEITPEGDVRPLDADSEGAMRNAPAQSLIAIPSGLKSEARFSLL